MRDGGAHPGLYLISGLGVQLSQHFKVLATCDAYEADGIARRRGVLIGFKNSNGRDVELFLSNEILFGDRTKLAKALSEARFSFVSADKPLGFLRCYLSDYECSLRAIVVRRAGWIERRDKLIGFMLPSGMIPENPVGETPYILDPVASTARYVSRGTIEDFKQGAARLAELHTLGRFRMASAFVGPLLKFTDQEGGGWHLWGPSSDIKSILDLLAMMVWGRAGRGGGFGRKWYGTANGAPAAQPRPASPRPPLHSTAYWTPPTTLDPATRPEPLIPMPSLNVAPGRPPRLMTLPPLHSVA